MSCNEISPKLDEVKNSADTNWDDSKEELLKQNDKVLETLFTEKEWKLYKGISTYKSKAAKLEHQKRLLLNFQMRYLSAGVAGMSLGKRQDRDEDGSDGVGSDLEKRLRLQD